ncbi:MAG: YcxB family protein [Chitinophagaceae bacterium]|nr:YcxB family protein [Chitinophagaceae bacterium]
MLTLRFNLTREEFLEYNYYTSWSSPDRKGYRYKYFLRVLVLYGAVAAGYVYINRFRHDLLTDIFVFGAIGIIYALIVPLLVRRSIKSRVNAMLRETENQHILEESEITLSEQGILDRDNASESRYNWEAIVKKVETKDCYYLYTSSYHAILIPIRALSSAEEKKELKRLLDQHLPLASELL